MDKELVVGRDMPEDMASVLKQVRDAGGMQEVAWKVAKGPPQEPKEGGSKGGLPPCRSCCKPW